MSMINFKEQAGDFLFHFISQKIGLAVVSAGYDTPSVFSLLMAQHLC